MEKTAELIKTKVMKNKATTLVAINKPIGKPSIPKIIRVLAISVRFFLLESEKTTSRSVTCCFKYQPRPIRIKLNNKRTICINYITIQSK